jgi:hypothetical protein
MVFQYWGVEISMSPENHGVPEDDDPFAYLYRGEGADGAAAAEAPQQPGVPRTSYQQATQVGRTQYGQQRPQQGAPQYGAAPLPHQATQQQNAQQQNPQQNSAYQPSQPPGGGRAGSRAGGAGGGGRGNSRGVMIGTVAVAAAVAIGIGVALFNGGGPSGSASAAGSQTNAASASSSATDSSSASPSASASATGTLPPPADAATMTLVGGAATANNHAGAKSANGAFVPLTAAGQGINWTVTVPTAGTYTFWVRFANAGADSSATVVVNGTANSSAINLKNYTHQTDWAKAWARSYVSVTLNQGQNTVGLTIAAGQGNVNIDQFALTPTKDDKPWS